MVPVLLARPRTPQSWRRKDGVARPACWYVVCVTVVAGQVAEVVEGTVAAVVEGLIGLGVLRRCTLGQRAP